MTTITTREGLDAVPIGTTIIDSHGDHLTKTGVEEWRDEDNEMDHDTDEILGNYGAESWLPAEVFVPTIAVEPKFELDGFVMTATDDTAEFWGVYTYGADHMATWDSDHDTEALAEIRAEQMREALK